MLHPINTRTIFRWIYAGGIWLKCRNSLNSNGRGKRSPALNCSLLKYIAWSSLFSVDTASPSVSSTDTPLGTQNRSRNSFTLNLSTYLLPWAAPHGPVEVTSWFVDIFSFVKTTWKRNQQSKHPQQNPKNQKTPTFTHTVASNLPKQVRTRPTKTNASKGKDKSKCTYQAEIWRCEVEIRSNVTGNKGKNHRQKNSRASLRKTKESTEGRRSITLRKKRSRKNATEDTVCYL